MTFRATDLIGWRPYHVWLQHAIRRIAVPVTSADAERAFSSYNKLVCYSRLSLSDESVRVLHSAAWNGDVTGRFEGYEY